MSDWISLHNLECFLFVHSDDGVHTAKSVLYVVKWLSSCVRMHDGSSPGIRMSILIWPNEQFCTPKGRVWPSRMPNGSLRLQSQEQFICDDTVPPPKEIAQFTLYSNKVGTNVHVGFVPATDGTLTRQLEAWAPPEGSKPCSRTHPLAVGGAHTKTSSVQTSVIEWPPVKAYMTSHGSWVLKRQLRT